MGREEVWQPDISGWCSSCACRAEYIALKALWADDPEVFERADILEERHRIDVDCRRTDRTQPLFAAQPTEPGFRPSFSPSTGDYGAQPPSNEHIETLAGILLTYDLHEKDLGAWAFMDLLPMR